MELVSTMGYIWIFSGPIALITGAWLTLNALMKKKLYKPLLVICIISLVTFMGLGYLLWFVIWPEFRKH